MSPSLRFPFDHPEEEPQVLGAALVYLDWTLADRGESTTRRARKERIVREKLEALKQLGVRDLTRDALGAHRCPGTPTFAQSGDTYFCAPPASGVHDFTSSLRGGEAGAVCG